VYLEAMACGLPIIGCKGSGVDEVISNGETGLLVPPGDGEALLSALWRLLSEHALRDRMGQCAVEYVRCAADSRVCIRRIEAFYVEVVRRHRSKELTNA
jgi:glycosyltransferase involved in cell wall biosynthesis